DDYTPALGGAATIGVGQSFVDITITPVSDSLTEGPETVGLTLVDTASYDVGSAASAIVTIADDPPAVAAVSLAATDSDASEIGGDPGTFRISRTGSTVGALTVNYTVATGPGQADGADYSPALSGAATIADGESFVDLSVTPQSDGLAEGPEEII